MLADDEFLRLGPIKSSDDTVCDVQTNIIHLKGEVVTASKQLQETYLSAQAAMWQSSVGLWSVKILPDLEMVSGGLSSKVSEFFKLQCRTSYLLITLIFLHE